MDAWGGIGVRSVYDGQSRENFFYQCGMNDRKSKNPTLGRVPNWKEGNGGRCRFRTCDPHSVNVVLYP
jgi:hypothetical protein